jgi:hypothetical protein
MTEDFDNEDDVARTAKRQRRVVSADECPYLDTVCRAVLDFDFEKICSVSLLSTNVYGCLVCGKYFQVSREHQIIDAKVAHTSAHVRFTFSPLDLTISFRVADLSRTRTLTRSRSITTCSSI